MLSQTHLPAFHRDPSFECSLTKRYGKASDIVGYREGGGKECQFLSCLRLAGYFLLRVSCNPKKKIVSSQPKNRQTSKTYVD